MHHLSECAEKNDEFMGQNKEKGFNNSRGCDGKPGFGKSSPWVPGAEWQPEAAISCDYPPLQSHPFDFSAFST
jgi:hypothetical protein